MIVTKELLAAFAAAARDFSPLHMSDEYARTTAYGQRAVHGICAVLWACGQFQPPAGHYPASLQLVFYHPIFLDTRYEVEISGNRVKVLDGSIQVVEMTFGFLPGRAGTAELEASPTAPLGIARVVEDAELQSTWSHEGTYGPGRSDYEALLATLNLDRAAWGDALPVGLMASSYLTGMEMPGARALYFRLQATFGADSFRLPASIRQELVNYDARWGVVKSRFSLGGDASAPWAGGEMQAFLRPLRNASLRAVELPGPELTQSLTGKVALVIGASRGLGAALALTMAAAGATVVALYARSAADAENLKERAQGLPGSIVLQQGDAASAAACIDIRSQLLATYGRLDWLVCSASPPLLPLRLEAQAFDRIATFIQTGFALTLAPLTACLEALTASSGHVLVISTVAVEAPPPAWPHYVALKTGIEGLTRTAAAAHPKVSFCIARPNKLNTDLVSTPMGNLKAEDPAAAALRILTKAAGTAVAGKVSFVS